MLKLDTNKHYYIGSARDIEDALFKHRENLASLSSTTYGWKKQQMVWAQCYPTRQAAYEASLVLADQYRLLFPDIPICGIYYPFGLPTCHHIDGYTPSQLSSLSERGKPSRKLPKRSWFAISAQLCRK